MESGWCSRFGGWVGSVVGSEGDILVRKILFVLVKPIVILLLLVYCTSTVKYAHAYDTHSALTGVEYNLFLFPVETIP